jgi:hypothetical protein
LLSVSNGNGTKLSPSVDDYPQLHWLVGNDFNWLAFMPFI